MNPRNGFWGRSKILMGPTSLRSSTTQRKQSIWDTYVWKWCLAEKILAPERGARRKCWWKATQVLLMLSWLLWVQSGYIATKLFVFKILTEAQCEIVHPEISRVQDQINKINNAAMAVHIFFDYYHMFVNPLFTIHNFGWFGVAGRKFWFTFPIKYSCFIDWASFAAIVFTAIHHVKLLMVFSVNSSYFLET